jgi:hypothetical protein
MTLAGALVLAATALAALPKGGSKYQGTTTAATLTGTKGKKFKDPVTFGVADAQHLTNFKFGEPSCQGSGGPPPSKNPYTSKSETANMGGILVAPSGAFDVTRNIKVGKVQTTTEVSGKFTKNTKTKKVTVKGTITFSQTFQGIKCGPSHLGWKAAPK